MNIIKRLKRAAWFTSRAVLCLFKKKGVTFLFLPYPEVSGRVAAGPMQRHVPWSIAAVRFRLAR